MEQLIQALKKIEQMSDSGSYENAIVNMKAIATEALKSTLLPNLPASTDITLTYKDYSAQGRTVQEAVKLLCELVEALPIEQEGEVLKDFSTELAIRLFQPFKDNDYSDLQKLSDRIAKEIGKIQFTIKRKSLEQEGEKIKKAIGFVGNKISEYEALIENNFKGLSMNPYVHEMRELNEVHNYLQSLITE